MPPYNNNLIIKDINYVVSKEMAGKESASKEVAGKEISLLAISLLAISSPAISLYQPFPYYIL